jgi:hypothetical protein
VGSFAFFAVSSNVGRTLLSAAFEVVLARDRACRLFQAGQIKVKIG